MKASEIREMEDQAILGQIEAKRQELFMLRLDWYANKLEDPNKMKVVRKDIARMLTILHERELALAYIQGEANGKAE